MGSLANHASQIIWRSSAKHPNHSECTRIYGGVPAPHARCALLLWQVHLECRDR